MNRKTKALIKNLFGKEVRHMHTYVKAKYTRFYRVLFINSLDETFKIVAVFKNEIQAATYVNFLNGGTQDIALINDLLKQATKH